MSAKQHEIEQFLYREARLLDTAAFETWLDLFTEDSVYWAPAGHDDIDPARHVSIIHDDKPALTRRVKRLRSGHAYAQDPASRVHRLISNVELFEFDETSGVLEVQCMMLLIELARHRQTIHSARCFFTLLKDGETWLIRRKKINLLRNNEPLEATAFLL
jgi:3-phenylpropionate/cinnamic acid dioxygenase small subunit